MPPPEFIDASGYIERIGQNTGGTRAKKLLQSHDGKDWFFKCSEYKPAKDGRPEKYYKYEFWSEIIASELGKLLGIDALDYKPAIFKDRIGCISPHMLTNHVESKLTEVGRYMNRVDPDFLPDDNKTRKQYTFQLLESTINNFGLTRFWRYFFETLIFDALIGNTDRHQENWAFIEYNIKVRFLKKDGTLGEKKTFNESVAYGMAPIYDSGSSLGRELNNERLAYLCEKEERILEYILNGKSEVHWKHKKVSHFILLYNILKTQYIEEVIRASKFLNNWNEKEVITLINNIDSTLPDEWSEYRIPNLRKKFILKVLILRAKTLQELFNERVR